MLTFLLSGSLNVSETIHLSVAEEAVLSVIFISSIYRSKMEVINYINPDCVWFQFRTCCVLQAKVQAARFELLSTPVNADKAAELKIETNCIRYEKQNHKTSKVLKNVGSVGLTQPSEHKTHRYRHRHKRTRRPKRETESRSERSGAK